MISSVFTLKESNYVPEELVSFKQTNLEEGYYMNSSLNFLLECHEELLSYRQDFYKSILEASDEYVINESFNEVISKIKVIIKKILAYIESLIKRFTTQLAKFVGSDKHIMKRKDEIRKFPSDESFTINGYEFTIDDKVPVIDIVGLDLNELRHELQAISDKTIVVKIEKLSELIVKLSDQQIDDICGQILGLDSAIAQSTFNEQVFAIYRDGKSLESTLTIKREDVLRALNDYEGYNDKIKQVKSLQNNITSKYKSLEKQVDDLVRSNMNLDGSAKMETELDSVQTLNNYKTNLAHSLDNLVIALTNRIQKISTLHVQAIAGKLDAYNALTIQDRNILYTALSTVQKDIKNMRMMKESVDLSIDESCYDYTRTAINRQYMTELHALNLRQQRFVDECLALSESNIPELKSINEDLKMDVKNKFDKLVEFLKSIYQKFLMKMNKFLTNNKDFLNKYKDVILTKKVEPYKLNNVPDYEAGIKNITNHKLPHIDIKSILSETEDTIKKKVLPAYTGNEELSEFAKKYFLSDNKPNREEVSSETLNMGEIYNFCINAPAALKNLEADRDAFIKEANTVKTAVLNVAAKNESTDLYGYKYYYSSVLESFINEEEGMQIQKDASNAPKQDAKADAKVDLTVDKNDTTDKNKDIADKVKQDPDDKGKDADTQAKENQGAEAKKIKETADWYLKALQTVCTAKITSFQRIYTEYMKILRYHVSQATGSMGSTTKFTEEDVNNIKSAMKEYKDAKDEAGKKSAADKIISIYKSRQMVIDAHDVQNLVNKNASKL